MKRLVGFGALAVVTMAFASGCSIEVGGWGSASADGKVVGTYQPLTLAPVPAYDSHCSPAPSLVGSAVCVCNDLSLSGSLRTHARHGETADVGVGGNVDLASGTKIDGSLRATGEVSSAGSLAVRHHLWAANGVGAAGELEIGGDLASGEDVSGAGDLSVGGLLRVSGENDWAGSKKVGGFGAYTAPTVAPCGCEGPALYDVAKAVAIAKVKNDNSERGAPPLPPIDKDGMIMVGSSQLTLDSGRYYVKGVSSVGDLRLRIRGEVQLYIDGDLESVGENRISIDKGGSLDLFVSGSVASAGDIELGDRDRPEAFRLYVGGAGSQISLAGSHAFYGVVYAPTSTVSIAGDTEVHGAIFARSLDKAGSLEVYGSKVTSYGERCEAKPVVNPPAPPPPAADSKEAPPPPPPPPPPSSDPDPCPDPADGGAPDASSGI